MIHQIDEPTTASGERRAADPPRRSDAGPAPRHRPAPPRSVPTLAAGAIAHSWSRDLLLLTLSLAGTFTFAGATAYLVSKALPGRGTVSLTSQLDSPPLDPAAYARGQQLYAGSCVTCHGAGATGVQRLGKDLVRSRMLLRGTDDELIAFIETGRSATDPANTSGIPMPPKGGNPALSAADIADIVVYLRGLQHPLRVPAGEAPAVVQAAPAAAQQEAVATAAPAPSTPAVETPTVSAADPEALVRGRKVYVSCLACHGKDGVGVKGMGKPLANSLFVQSKTDDQLLEFIKKGRGPTDPDNTTKMGMPPKGGNPALNDKQLRDLIAYLRSLDSSSGQK